jgi:hypothetical protein
MNHEGMGGAFAPPFSFVATNSARRNFETKWKYLPPYPAKSAAARQFLPSAFFRPASPTGAAFPPLWKIDV